MQPLLINSCSSKIPNIFSQICQKYLVKVNLGLHCNSCLQLLHVAQAKIVYSFTCVRLFLVTICLKHVLESQKKINCNTCSRLIPNNKAYFFNHSCGDIVVFDLAGELLFTIPQVSYMYMYINCTCSFGSHKILLTILLPWLQGLYVLTWR